MDSECLFRCILFLSAVQVIKYLPMLYVDATPHKQWRDDDSWYKKLKKPPI